MRSISVRDLLRFPELSQYTELDIIQPSMDKLIKPYLHIMGMDTNHDVEYTVNIHRDLGDFVAMGYRIVGSLRHDDEFRDSPFCDLIDRIAMTGYYDVSLTKELSEMLDRPVDYELFTEGAYDSVDGEFDETLIEPTYEESKSIMRSMYEQLKYVRGDLIRTTL